MRTLDELRAFVRAFQLELHDPALARDLASITPERLRGRDRRLMASIHQRLDQYQAFHEEYPFVTAPPGAFSPGTVLGFQAANRLPVMIAARDLTRHVGVFGGTGCGKTTFTHNAIQQLLTRGQKLFILDPKNDSEHLAVMHDFLVLSPRARLNLLQLPRFLSREEFLNVFTHVWATAWYAGENQKQVLDAGLDQAFAEHETPSLADLKGLIDRLHSPKLTYQRRDAITGVSNRLARFGRMFPGPFHTRRGVTYEELFQHSLYMHALFNDEHTTFLYTFLVYLLYLHNRRTGIRDRLDYLLVNDEGNRFWNVHQSNIQEAPTLVHLQGLIREFGIGLWHTSVDERSLHPILKSNTHLHVAMSVTSGQEEQEAASMLGLTREQRAYLRTRLGRGQCIIRFGDGWREPLLCSFPYSTHEKRVTPAARTEAEERINRYAPPQLPEALQTPQEHAGTEPQEPDGSRETARKPASRSHPARPPDAGAAEEPRRPPMQLTATEERLLRASLDRLLVATAAYTAAGLARQAGQTAKDRLVALGLLRESSILVRAGRGGNALLLEPTAAAYELLGRHHQRGTRGGDSAQHRWLIQELAARLPAAQVEFLLGGKSIDLLIRYDPNEHERLIFYIESKLPPDALIAIEVECSDPTSTAPSNITKNAAAGVSWTIIAVLPRQLERTRSSLSRRSLARYVVVDVFALLEGCER